MISLANGLPVPLADEFAVDLLSSGRQHVVETAPETEVVTEINRSPAGELADEAQRRERTMEKLSVCQSVPKAGFDKWRKKTKVGLDVVVPSQIGTSCAYTVLFATGRRACSYDRCVVRNTALRIEPQVRSDVADAV